MFRPVPAIRAGSRPAQRPVTWTPRSGSLATSSRLGIFSPERKENLLKQKHQGIVCEICLVDNAYKKCQKCTKSMCLKCTEKHKDLVRFNSHVLQPLCVEHFEGIAYFCTKCLKPACINCLVALHSDHEANTMDYDKGVDFILTQLNEMETKVTNLREERVKKRLQFETKVEVNGEIKSKIDDIFETQKKFIANTRKLKEKMNGVYETNRISCKDQFANAEDVLGDILSRIQALQGQNDESLFEKFSSVRKFMEKKLSTIEKNDCLNYEIAPFVLADPSNEEIVSYWKLSCIENTISPAELKHQITKATCPELEAKWPRQIVCCNESVFVAAESVHNIIRLELCGNLIAKYFPSNMSAEINGVAIYNDHVYIHTDKEITKLPLSCKAGMRMAVYLPSVPNIGKILVVNSSVIFIADCQRDGRIWEFNIDKNKTKPCVDNLKEPSFLSVVNTEFGPRYVVSLNQENYIRVYDKKWELITEFGQNGSDDGQLKNPRGTAVTSGGNILVADYGNNRVTEFQLDGKFVGHIVTSADGVTKPRCLDYQYPYMWLADGGWLHTAIKCFRIARRCQEP